MGIYRLNMPDAVLIVLILLFSGGYILFFHLHPDSQPSAAKTAVVYHNGKPVHNLSLAGEETIALLKGKMLIETMPGRIRIIESKCPRQLCVHAGWISSAGQVITCVPGKVLIEIRSEAPPFIDAVVW